MSERGRVLPMILFGLVCAACSGPPSMVSDLSGSAPDAAVVLDMATPDLAASADAAPPKSQFAPRVDFKVGMLPLHVLATNFGGKHDGGRPPGSVDLVITNHTSTSLSLFLWRGLAGKDLYSPLPGYDLPYGPIGSADGDFDEDGIVDLAVCAQGSALTFTGKGDGVFSAGPMLPSAFAGDHSFGGAGAVADVNGDLHLDIVLADNCADCSTVQVFLGDGKGGFAKPIVSRTDGVLGDGGLSDGGPATRPFFILARDLDGDGKVDLAVTEFGRGRVSILRGQGDGTFLPIAAPAVGALPSIIAEGDLNGDGLMDLVVTSPGEMLGINSVTLLFGDGKGHFPRVASACGAMAPDCAGGTPTAVAVADFDGDGHADLAITAYSDNAVRILLGRGDGTFRDPLIFATEMGPDFVVARDLDGDGKPDLAIVNHDSGSLSIFINTWR